jgi:hypothetical protein
MSSDDRLLNLVPRQTVQPDCGADSGIAMMAENHADLKKPNMAKTGPRKGSKCLNWLG